MNTDGTLIIHIGQSSDVELRQVHAPGSSNYSSYVVWAGSPSPGERKSIPIYSGLASMDEEGVITFTVGSDNTQGLTVEPSMGRINPGHPEFQAMIDWVGGLGPGEFRGIPEPLPLGCSSMQ
jgi:hypothetical protein